MTTLQSLLPLRADVVTLESLTTRLGYSPDILAIRKFMESQGYHLCQGGVFKRAAALVRKSGREPSEKERTESRIVGIHFVEGGALQ